MPIQFKATAIQADVHMVDETDSASAIRKVMARNMERAVDMIDWAGHGQRTSSSGSLPQLIGLPESFLHSFPRARKANIEDMRKVCIDIPGEETEILAAKAREYNAYIFGATYTVDPDWPGRYFNTAFIIDPAGNVALKYNKIRAMSLLESCTSPHDVLDEYIDRYGWESLFPVLDSPIGRLGIFICGDALHSPEVPRALMMRGAEVLLWPISTASPDHHYYHLAAQAHAYFNGAYLVSPNVGITHAKKRAAGNGGESVIVDYKGRILQKSSASGESNIHELLSIDMLRTHRLSAQAGPSALRSEVFAPLYQKSYVPANFFAHDKINDLDDVKRHRRATIENLVRAGVVVEP